MPRLDSILGLICIIICNILRLQTVKCTTINYNPFPELGVLPKTINPTFLACHRWLLISKPLRFKALPKIWGIYRNLLNKFLFPWEFLDAQAIPSSAPVKWTLSSRSNMPPVGWRADSWAWSLGSRRLDSLESMFLELSFWGDVGIKTEWDHLHV